MIKAVIFDWDGTLVNNMKYHYLSFKKVLEEVGIRIKPKDIYLLEGRGALEIIASIMKREIDEEVKKLMEKKYRIYEKLARDIKILPQAKKLVTKLKLNERKLKIGLVTGSRKKNVLAVLEKTRDIGLFDAIITVEDVKKTKPAGEPYLKCIKKLEINPNEAVVVENSPLGVEAAKLAGIKCIAITSTLPKKFLKNANWIVKGLEDVEKLIYLNLND